MAADTPQRSEPLESCPWCGEKARFKSNRDWHRIFVNHKSGCYLHDTDPLMWPATDEDKAEAITAWNRRASPSAGEPTREQIRKVPACSDCDEPDKCDGYGCAWAAVVKCWGWTLDELTARPSVAAKDIIAELLEEMAGEIESYVNVAHGGPDNVSLRRRYDRDMEVVKRARETAALYRRQSNNGQGMT